MPIGITEIDAFAATLPCGPTLYYYPVSCKMVLPSFYRIAADRKSKMNRSITVVSWDYSAW